VAALACRALATATTTADPGPTLSEGPLAGTPCGGFASLSGCAAFTGARAEPGPATGSAFAAFHAASAEG
jgi:hypothetical protein